MYYYSQEGGGELSYSKLTKSLSEQVINENRRVYLPAMLKELGFDIGTEVEILADPKNKEVKIKIAGQNSLS